MQKLGQFLLWAATGIVGLIMFAAQVRLTDATSNLATWLPQWVLDRFPALQSAMTDRFVLWAGAITLIILAGALFWLRKASAAMPLSDKLGLIPNWPIRDLFFHIDPSITKNPHRDPEKQVGRDVLDHLATGQLHAWGRFTGSNGALIPIPQEFWKDAEWVMMFFGEDDADLVHARYRETNTGYRDVQFNRAEALAIWPKSIKTDWPDYTKWDAVDPLELYQAACLWADVEPALPWPSWGAEKVYRKINDHIRKSSEPFAVPSGETTREAIVEAIETQRSGLLNPRGKILRDDLKRIATAWGEQPRFLYARSRL